MPVDYPPPSFHFRVVFQMQNAKGVSLRTEDAYFQSVSGLNVEMQTESIKEAGENRFEHVLPARSRYSDLVLKRGVLKDSGVIQWCRKAIEHFLVDPINIQVQLLNENHQPLVEWHIIHAWPKKWSASDLNAEQSALLVETMELNYNYFTVNHSAPQVNP